MLKIVFVACFFTTLYSECITSVYTIDTMVVHSGGLYTGYQLIPLIPLIFTQQVKHFLID